MTISIVIYILAFFIILQSIWLLVLERRIKKFFAGTKARDLESVMSELGNQATELKKVQHDINTHLLTLDTRVHTSIRKIETIRFNPFMDAGSNQSFAIALLDDNHNGVVLSSLYARERMSIFAKPIINGESEFELSVEEKEVIKKSM